MSGNFAWNLSTMDCSTAWDCPGWLVQKSNEPAGLTPVKSMSEGLLLAALPLVDGPPHAARAAAPTPRPASPRKFLRSRFIAMVGPLKDAKVVRLCLDGAAGVRGRPRWMVRCS